MKSVFGMLIGVGILCLVIQVMSGNKAKPLNMYFKFLGTCTVAILKGLLFLAIIVLGNIEDAHKKYKKRKAALNNAAHSPAPALPPLPLAEPEGVRE